MTSILFNMPSSTGKTPSSAVVARLSFQNSRRRRNLRDITWNERRGGDEACLPNFRRGADASAFFVRHQAAARR